MKYKRILLKLSGEGLMGNKSFGLDEEMLASIAREIKLAHDAGVQIAVVIGGGNIFRGLSGAAGGMDRVRADHMGMLATVINSLAMQDALERIGVSARVVSGVMMPTICEPYVQPRVKKKLADGSVIIFAAGTGNPFFTTDTGAALRAAEMGCEAIFKATQVDGVYSADPKKDKNAVRFEKVSYDEVLVKQLKVMDAAAIALARDNNIEVVVFSMHGEKALYRALNGEGAFTVITDAE
ncbi:MAG: UMP kinase [Alphaproteobacteria bacterium]|nr:UMP kinase [Alphaproteobacteria bacterium]